MSAPLETAELLAFVKTVDAKSLSRAAAELTVPRATISRRLARLEERLGTRLLRRTTRSLTLTDAGDAFYRRAQLVLEAVRGAEESVRRKDASVRGELRVSVPNGLSGGFFEMVCDFAEKYPEVRLHLHFSSQLVDLQRSGYDVAIRASSTMAPGLIGRQLIKSTRVAVASPAYLAKHGTPRAKKDLTAHRCLMGFTSSELPQAQWPLSGGGNLHVDGWLFSNDIAMLAAAAERGLGIALLPRPVVAPQLERGTLVQVLAGLLEVEGKIMVVYPEREFIPPQVRAFVDAVVAWAPTALGQPRPARSHSPTRRAEPVARSSPVAERQR